MRKHAAWYIKGIKGAAELRKRAFKITDISELERLAYDIVKRGKGVCFMKKNIGNCNGGAACRSSLLLLYRYLYRSSKSKNFLLKNVESVTLSGPAAQTGGTTPWLFSIRKMVSSLWILWKRSRAKSSTLSA